MTSEMTHPTDDELEAMAQYWGAQAQKAASQDAMLTAEKFGKTAAMLRACKGRVRVKVDAALKRAEELASIYSDWSADEIQHYRRELAKSGDEPAPDYGEWNAAIEAAVREIDCGCDGPCQWPHACPKEDVESIRQLKKGSPHDRPR